MSEWGPVGVSGIRLGPGQPGARSSSLTLFPGGPGGPGSPEAPGGPCGDYNTRIELANIG